MNFSDMLSLAKLFTLATNSTATLTMSSEELEVACEVLKKLADEKAIWSQEQKEYYKLLVDYAKELTKGTRKWSI